ncbi:hypothetical protein AC1031_015216 [Aphanomyces cochlioides]|nr:hypothetical protein AC1031_015216 [Aphanomyces cochlioides]
MKTANSIPVFVAALALTSVSAQIPLLDVDLSNDAPATTSASPLLHVSVGSLNKALPITSAPVVESPAPTASDTTSVPTTTAASPKSTPTTTTGSTPGTTASPSVPKTTSNKPTTTSSTPSGTSTTAVPSTSGSPSPTTISSTSSGAVQCPFVFTSAIVTTQFNSVLDEILSKNTTSNATSDVIVGPSGGNSTNGSNTTLAPTTSSPSNSNSTSNNTTAVPGTTSSTTTRSPDATSPTTTTSAPDTSRQPTPSPTASLRKTPTPSETKTPVTTSPVSTPATTNDSSSEGRRRRRLADNSTTSDVVAFACDASFYGKWVTSGLKCGGQDLDVDTAVQHAACATYNGNVPLAGVTVASCLTTCYFPSCVNGKWDYSTDKTKPGFGSAIYANFDFTQWFSSSINAQIEKRTQNIVDFKNFSMTVFSTCTKASDCSCPVYQPPADSKQDPKADLNARIQEAKEQAARANDYAPQKNWEPTTVVEHAASYTATLTQYATYVGVVSSASAVAVTSVSSAAAASSAGAASAAGSAASVGVAAGLLDMASFVTSLSQLNIPRLPATISNVGSSVSVFQFSFIKWEGAKYVAAEPLVGRSLAEIGQNNSMTGMERYAAVIGVKPNMLFYVTLVGLLTAAAAVGLVLALVLIVGKFVSKDYPTYQVEMTDRAVGAMMFLAVVAQYAIGVTGTFEITRNLDNHQGWGASVFVAFASLLILSVGTIVYGYVVVRRHEHEIRDIGTKDHFEKTVHRRYGCLYDEYNYQNRFFFVGKMLLALLVGITTGMSNLSGLAQVVIMIGLHVIFVLLLEVRQPHMARFVQATTTLINVMKIASMVMTVFLLSAVFALPDSARTIVGYVILSLQGLVVLFLVVRQVFIFYRQWKIKQLPEEDQERISVTEFYGQSNTTTQEIDKVHSSRSMNVEHANAQRLPPLNHPNKEYAF